MKKKESKAAVRERVRKWRAKKKGENTINVTKSPPCLGLSAVTDDDIKLLPPSMRFAVDCITRQRKTLKIPDNERERLEAAVRRFRGY